MSDTPSKSEKDLSRLDSSNKPVVDHQDHAGPSNNVLAGAKDDDPLAQRQEVSLKLANPLAGLGQEELRELGEEYCRKNGFTDPEDVRAFSLGARIAGNLNKWDQVKELNEAERSRLEREITHKWSNPWKLYGVIVVCSLCAAVQGMGK